MMVTLPGLATEPSQAPLTSRTGATPQPNLMITLDDSGSMLLDYMPAGSVAVNNFQVRLDNTNGKGDRIGAFPADKRKEAVGMVDGYVTGLLSGATPYQMQYRSPDVNYIWYNPETRYRPWIKPAPKSDGSADYMANVSATAAPWDPFSTGLNPSNYNLTVNKTGGSGITANWCDSSSSSCPSSKKDFYPGLFYRLKAGADPTKVASFVMYNLNDANNFSPTRTTKPSGRSDCTTYTDKCTQAEEKTNFANWFTYYRMRESLAKAAVTEALFGYQNKMRVGWARINDTGASVVDTGSTVKFKAVQKGILPLDKTHLQTVLTGIQGLRSSGGTPLRIALDNVGPYFDNRTDPHSPWQSTIGATSSPGNQKLSCRRSFNLLTTDGYYNDGYSGAGDLNNVDSSYVYPYSASQPDQNPGNYSPTGYKAVRPFIDDPANKSSDSLTDVAMKWYYKDLDGNIANKVTPTSDDIAYWQHLTQFTIGIGVKGTLDSSTPEAKAATLAKLADASKNTNWPKPDSDPKKIDDLWHAAVNTGGEFYPVRNSNELVSAITNVFGKAVGNEARESGVATVASTLITDNLKFVPQYRSGAWYGDVLAFKLDENGDVVGTEPEWRASVKLPAHASRNLVTWSGSKGLVFDYATMNAQDSAGLALIGGQALLEYIRGDSIGEGNAGAFRSRGGQYLGDFINSPPVYVKNLLNHGYESLTDSAQAGSYASFLSRKNARSTGVVAIGGNGGVFHTFNGSDGVETFGFVPRASFPLLATIANKTYGTSANYHRFVVDGPASEADAYIQAVGASTAGWTNMLLGSMGSGGKGLFALTVPTDDPTTMNANSVQWELNDHEDLGYVMSEVRTGKIQNGSDWYAFVGNGPYSSSGKAALLVINLQTGSVVKSIQVPSSGASGLGGVRLLRNSHQEVYAAYAGDLEGNLWRFDFPSGDAPSGWKVAFDEMPLFKATTAAGATTQAIVAAPSVMPHPDRGHMVLFGTGRLIDSADSTSSAKDQTYYGIWDSTPIGASAAEIASPFKTASESGGAAPYRSVLVEQTIDTSDVVSGQKADSNGNLVNTTERYYKISANPVDYTAKKGWFIDLTIANGQRVIYPSQTILNYVYFSTMVPAAEAAECEFTVGTGYNFVVDGVSGGAMSSPVFDVNNDGVVDDQDESVAGYQTLADGVDKLLTGQEGIVDDFSTQQCIPDLNKKCTRANACLVVVVNTSSEAEEVCVDGPVREECLPGVPKGDPYCLCPDGSAKAADGTCPEVGCPNGQVMDADGNCTTTPKVIRARVWRQILNHP